MSAEEDFIARAFGKLTSTGMDEETILAAVLGKRRDRIFQLVCASLSCDRQALPILHVKWAVELYDLIETETQERLEKGLEELKAGEE